MSLNVKDPEAHRLAQAIAQETGETITRAVHRSPARTLRPYLDHAELLYNENGLPK